MKLRYLARCVLFLLPVAIALVGAELRLRRSSPSILKFKKEFVESALATNEILIVGTSHEYWGVDPGQFHRPGFNLAGDLQSLYYSTALVEYYADRMPHLRCVVLGLSYFSLELGLAGSPESYRQLDYWDVFGIPPEAGWNRDNLKDSIVILRRGVPLARELLLASFFGRIDPGIPLPEKNGWLDARSAREAPAIGSGEARVRLHAGLMRPELFQENVDRVKHLLDFLEKRHVRVVLVTLPAQLSYRSNIDRLHFDRMQGAIASLVRGRNDITYANYFQDYRFYEGDFVNSDHLNGLGARKFARLLDKEALAGL